MLATKLETKKLIPNATNIVSVTNDDSGMSVYDRRMVKVFQKMFGWGYLLLLLLAVFILQNTQKVEVSFLGWNGHAPLAATLLLAAVAGSVVVATAGLLRILQLRRRVKRSGNATRS